MTPSLIDTAPQDGTEILIWIQSIGWKSALWYEEAWCVDDGKHGPFPIRGYPTGAVTHWLPLPPAPEAT